MISIHHKCLTQFYKLMYEYVRLVIIALPYLDTADSPVHRPPLRKSWTS